MNSKILELLFHSLDGELTREEQQKLDQALAKSKELREEKERITQMRKVISNSRSQGFHPFFAEKVMRGIREAKNAQETFWDSLVYVFRPVAFAATILLITLISFNLIKSGNISVASAFAESEITLEQALDPTLSLVME